ncbi:hypothetical protein [Pseudomonas baltica]|uniref:hypothetical protein n=1 Tax=Pseudomonas baltica TaxID=2762576 RepID=UPI0028A1CBD7|nr:hypothetical protein [Pseudomonas baltica]
MDFVFKIGYGLEIFQKKYDRGYVRKAIGGQWKTHPKSEFTENSIDTFGDIVARAFYDASDILTGIEFSALKAKFWINNCQFLGKTIGQVKSRLSIMEIDFEEEEDETGINILNNAVRFYAPEMDDLVDLAKIVSIYVCIETIDGE